MKSLQRESRRLARILRFSVDLLRAHQLRTALSISGLVVGVATVIVMVAAGKGAERRVVERIEALGTNVLVVTAAPAPRVVGRQRQVSTMTALRPEDADAIAQETGLAAAAAPAVHRSLIARWQDRSSSVAVTGTTTVGLDIRGIRASRGRLFDDDEDRERRRVAVLGPTVARNFFDAASPVGREIRIGTIPFEVVGVASPRGIDIAGSDLDNEVVIPLQTAMRRLLNVPYVNAIVVQATKSERLDDLEEDVQAILSRRHPARAGAGDAAPYVIQNQAELLRTERGATQAFNRMITSTAALALLVGGVGIVAVMLLSIRERTREIGLRRALGARRRDIQIQFLLESALLAVTGGVCGIVVGLFVAAVAAAFGRWELAFPWLAALAAIATSVALGLLMGVLPASHAGRLEPSVALRSG